MGGGGGGGGGGGPPPPPPPARGVHDNSYPCQLVSGPTPILYFSTLLISWKVLQWAKSLVYDSHSKGRRIAAVAFFAPSFLTWRLFSPCVRSKKSYLCGFCYPFVPARIRRDWRPTKREGQSSVLSCDELHPVTFQCFCPDVAGRRIRPNLNWKIIYIEIGCCIIEGFRLKGFW